MSWTQQLLAASAAASFLDETFTLEPDTPVSTWLPRAEVARAARRAGVDATDVFRLLRALGVVAGRYGGRDRSYHYPLRPRA